MEQPRPRRGRRAALILVITALGVGAWWLLRIWNRAPEAETQPAARDGPAIVAEVRNGSGRRGLARVVTRLLRERGIDVVYFGTAADTVRSTQVLVRRGELTLGHEVARALGSGVVRIARDALLRVDVTVLLGVDYVVPPGTPPF